MFTTRAATLTDFISIKCKQSDCVPCQFSGTPQEFSEHMARVHGINIFDFEPKMRDEFKVGSFKITSTIGNQRMG